MRLGTLTSIFPKWRLSADNISPPLQLVKLEHEPVSISPWPRMDVQADHPDREDDPSGRAAVSHYLSWASQQGEAGEQTAVRAYCLYCEFADFVDRPALDRREFWRQLEDSCVKSRPRILVDGQIKRPVVYRLPDVSHVDRASQRSSQQPALRRRAA